MRPNTYKPFTIPLAVTIILCFSNEVHSFVNPFYNYYKKSASPRIVCDGLQADQTDCASCLEVVTCNADGSTTPFTTCTAPNACATTGSGLAYCTTYTETPCDCATPQCDPYDSNFLLICSDDGPVDTQDCSVGGTLDVVCLEGECQAGVVNPLCDGTDLDEGWNVLGPNCDVGYYCTSVATPPVPPTEKTCGDGEYFDPDAGSCAALPVNSCEGCSGYCPDKLDCSYYYVCEAGIDLTHQQCPGGACVDVAAKDCSNTNCDVALCPATSVCDGLTGTSPPDTTTTSDTITDSSTTTTSDIITDSSTTTTTISPGEITTPDFDCTEDTAGNYATGDCNHEYLSCQQVSPGQWEYVSKRCFGDTFFNPTTGYCDYADNISGCQV